jgi:hypothetical protein
MHAEGSMDQPKPQRYLSPEQSCAYLLDRWNIPCRPATLNKWRVIGGGPQYVKFGRIVRYTAEWLDEWVDNKLSPPVRSSSELKSAERGAA